MRSVRFCVLAAMAQVSFGFAKLSPRTANDFDRYVAAAETRMSQDLQRGRFLRVESEPDVKTKLRGGELRIEPGAMLDRRNDVQVRGGLLQDWLGMMFIPGATLAGVRAVLQDYDHYKNFYKPEVIESGQLSHQDDEYDIFLRLYEKNILTVVLNTSYRVRYRMLDAHRMCVESHSTRIAQVKDPDRSYTEEEPPDNDLGLLWRLNSYWRFVEAEGGVYAECESISLSRDVPLGLSFMLKGFLEGFPKESMMNTLRGTRQAVLKQAAATRPATIAPAN